MPRIGTVIREVYHRPDADALPAHLEDHYGIQVTATARLAIGVFRVEHDAGPPWVARMFLTSRPVDRTEEDAEVLRFLARREFPAERCALWLAAWQCWLACLSPKVSQAFVPYRSHITALSDQGRAHSGRRA